MQSSPTNRQIKDSDFEKGTDVLSGHHHFVILSYVSRGDDTRGRPWARCQHDQDKLEAAYNYVQQRHGGALGVWVDLNFNSATDGHERFGFSPFRTLGAIYRHAAYTLAILEEADADWLIELCQHANQHGDSEQEHALAQTWLTEPRCESFEQQIASNQYSYWNRAWVAQEIFQSHAILYCKYEAGTIQPIIEGRQLARLSVKVINYTRTAEFASQFHPANDAVQNAPLRRAMKMSNYLWYANTPSGRAQYNVNYDYRADLMSFITTRTLHASTRRDALSAVAILFEVNALPVETAVAQAVHHEMIRRGRVPVTSFDRPGIQRFSNSAWASRYEREARNTEEMTQYIPTPTPFEITPDGSLLVVARGVEAIIGKLIVDDPAKPTRQIWAAQHLVATVPSKCINAPLERTQAFLLSTVSALFLVGMPDSNSDGVLYSILSTWLSQPDILGIEEQSWRVRVVRIWRPYTSSDDSDDDDRTPALH